MQQRIIIFAAYFLPFSGGYANSIFQLAVRLKNRGHIVTVVTANTEGAAAEESLQGIQVYRLACWNILGGTYPIPKLTNGLRKLLHQLRADHYTVVSTQTRFFITSLLGAIFARFNRMPYVHTERGSKHSIVRNKFVYWVSIFVDHTLGRWIVRGAKDVIGVSTAAKDFALHLGAKAAQVIPNGVNEEFTYQSAQRNIPDTKKGINILYVGRLIYAKGVQDLLSAVANLRRSGKDLRLTIIGSGTYLSNLQDLVSQLKLQEAVTFIGEQTREQIAKLFLQHDLFINPSYSEGLPTSVLEAAAVGIPVIATDVGGTKEVIPLESFGQLYSAGKVKELEAAIIRYYNNPEQSIKAASLLAERTNKIFSWSAVAVNYEAEFIKVASYNT